MKLSFVPNAKNEVLLVVVVMLMCDWMKSHMTSHHRGVRAAHNVDLHSVVDSEETAMLFFVTSSIQ